MFADFYTVAARTGGEGSGMMGISLILVERSRAGVSTREMDCMGAKGSGTAFVEFDNVRVPKTNYIGDVTCLLRNFITERLGIALQVCMYVCMYACIYICIYLCMHVCMHVCRCIYSTDLCIFRQYILFGKSCVALLRSCTLRGHACVRMYVCMYVCMYLCIARYARTFCAVKPSTVRNTA
jgi:hypothetical protein